MLAYIIVLFNPRGVQNTAKGMRFHSQWTLLYANNSDRRHRVFPSSGRPLSVYTYFAWRALSVLSGGISM